MKSIKYDEAGRGHGHQKNLFKARVIYQPRGRAFEYSSLACNLYNGCVHGCTYCYAPSVTRKTMEEFVQPYPRHDVLKKLEQDAKELSGDPRRVLFCFTSDPYQPIEEKHRITRSAFEICGENNVKTNVLTKNGLLARRDFDLMEKYGTYFGSTLLLTEEKDRELWEPDAGKLIDRNNAINEAITRGITTWISVEPVVDTEQALSVIKTFAGRVDLIKVGKLNHDRKREDAINWKKFLTDALFHLNLSGGNYLIKDDLWKFATPDIMTQYAQ